MPPEPGDLFILSEALWMRPPNDGLMTVVPEGTIIIYLGCLDLGTLSRFLFLRKGSIFTLDDSRSVFRGWLKKIS